MAEQDAPKKKYDWDKFYAVYGRCINEWAYIDEELCTLFTLVLGTDEKRAATVYYKFSTIGPRFEITDKLLNLALAEEAAFAEFIIRWKPIASQFKGQSLLSFRNDLAHELVMGRTRARVIFGTTPEDAERKKAALKKQEDIKLGPFQQVERPARKSQVTGKPQIKHSIDDLADHLKKAKELKMAIATFRWDLYQKAREQFLQQEAAEKSGQDNQNPPTETGSK